jgi:hypothetical protein
MQIAFAALACLFGFLSLAEGIFYVDYTLGLVQSDTVTTTEFIATTACLCFGLIFVCAGILAFKHKFRAGTVLFALPFIVMLFWRVVI